MLAGLVAQLLFLANFEDVPVMKIQIQSVVAHCSSRRPLLVRHLMILAAWACVNSNFTVLSSQGRAWGQSTSEGAAAVSPLPGFEAGPDLERLFPGAEQLAGGKDLASEMVEGLDRFLLRKTNQSAQTRGKHWDRNFGNPVSYADSVDKNRQALARLLGMSEQRHAGPRFEIAGDCFRWAGELDDGVHDEGAVLISQVRWPVLSDPDPGRTIPSTWGEGVIIEPESGSPIVADVLLVPDCGQSPSELIRAMESGDAGGKVRDFFRQLIRRRCRILIPMLVDRELKRRNGRATLTGREWIYRPAFELGRHLIGYEASMLLSAVDAMTPGRPVLAVGIGEGGRIVLTAAAIDRRLSAVAVLGCIGESERMWREPIDRNIFGWLGEFGDAELLTMVAPRPVWVGHGPVGEVVLDGNGGGAPGQIRSIGQEEGRREVERARELVRPLIEREWWTLREYSFEDAALNSDLADALGGMLDAVAGDAVATAETPVIRDSRVASESFSPDEHLTDDAEIQQRIQQRMDRHTQLLLRESPFEREAYFSKLNTDTMEAFDLTVEPYRKDFSQDIIGEFDDPFLACNPRVRKRWTTDRWSGYEVLLDVFPDVIAYGVLLVPHDLKEGERRPVVVCQHGLEGRPTDTFQGDHRAYHDFAGKLAEKGYIVFAPQNPYLFGDRFRTLQRKANPLGKTLFSLIIAQHRQIVRWLLGLPMVAPDKIAFYGLSYGGKSAMRIPALVTSYCLSICSADFNEWVVKNASTRHPFSYTGTGEYEIFEWNLGSRFNYAEMATLICPRPFMVERGHRDGVGRDEWVAHEYAKVRFLYAARLGIPNRTEIEWFDGPHTINGKGTFRFLDKHLRGGQGEGQP